MPEVAERRHELPLARRQDPVADPIRTEALDDLADLLAPHLATLLADVDRHAEPRIARGLDQRLELRVVVAAASGARAGDVDADHPSVRPADRLLDDDLVQAEVEGAIHHQDQPGAYLRVLDARAVDAPDRGEDDVVEVALAAAVSLHRVEAELERRDPLRAVRAADRAVDGALDGERRRLDQLRPVVDLVELVEPLHAVRVGDGDERVELPEVLHRERDPLLVRDGPEDVRGDRAAEVGVELGEPFALEDHRASVRLPLLVEHRVESRGELDRAADEEEAEEEPGCDSEHAVRLLLPREPREEEERVEQADEGQRRSDDECARHEARPAVGACGSSRDESTTQNAGSTTYDTSVARSSSGWSRFVRSAVIEDAVDGERDHPGEEEERGPERARRRRTGSRQASAVTARIARSSADDW